MSVFRGLAVCVNDTLPEGSGVLLDGMGEVVAVFSESEGWRVRDDAREPGALARLSVTMHGTPGFIRRLRDTCDGKA